MTELTLESICTSVRDYLVSGPLSGQDVSFGDELLLTGTLDSLSVMRLVAYLELAFCVDIPNEDVTLAHFRSISAMAEYVLSRGARA